MNIKIDKLDLNEQNLTNLSRIKALTNLKHNNHVCTWALVISLLINNSPPPITRKNNTDIPSIDWLVFGGKNEGIYLSLLKMRLKKNRIEETKNNLESELAKHVTRGLSIMAANKKIGYKVYKHPELADYRMRNCHLLLNQYLGKSLAK